MTYEDQIWIDTKYVRLIRRCKQLQKHVGILYSLVAFITVTMLLDEFKK